jgi:hypothetical protein
MTASFRILHSATADGLRKCRTREPPFGAFCDGSLWAGFDWGVEPRKVAPSPVSHLRLLARAARSATRSLSLDAPFGGRGCLYREPGAGGIRARDAQIRTTNN